MSLPVALPRRESRRLASCNARQPLALVESHPTNEELDGLRQQSTSKSMGKALTRHVHGCDRCAQRFAELVWYDLWAKLG